SSTMEGRNPNHSDGKGNGQKSGLHGGEGNQGNNESGKRKEDSTTANVACLKGNKLELNKIPTGGNSSGSGFKAAAQAGGGKISHDRGATPSPSSFKEALGSIGGNRASKQAFLVDLAKEDFDLEIKTRL
ncbi:hypothetical protein KI387_032609, partial [Taxus chinensis]